MKNLTPRAGRGPHHDLDKEKFWRETLREFRAGGQSVRQFCKARGLTEPSFYCWRRTIARRDQEHASPGSAHPAFVELRAQEPIIRASDAPLEIVAGQRRLLIRPGCDRDLLRDVLAALEA
jgi:hypothetical protein